MISKRSRLRAEPDLITGIGCVGLLLSGAIYLGVIAGVIYAAYHFIVKFW